MPCCPGPLVRTVGGATALFPTSARRPPARVGTSLPCSVWSTVVQTGRVCAICGESFWDKTPMKRDDHPVHTRCFEAGERIIGVTAAIMAEQRGVLFCAGCLATELGVGRVESQSALWHVARTIQVLRGRCGCGALGWRLA